ncbi:hypothetical protein Tco_1032338 [Tanacetum coccineum]|uniref:Uncharacterized protein n=1 Tax=Tanacetum coccineum TaxID=301880 RepID=A0ABQ5GBJ7_9ASTR
MDHHWVEMMVQQDLSQVEGTLLVKIVDEQVLGKIVDEPLVFDKQLVQSMISNQLVLYMVVVMEEMCRIVKQLVKAVGDTVMDCTEVDDCCSMEYIEPYEKLEHVVTEADVSLIKITEPPSSSTKDASAPNVVLTIQTESPLSIPSMASLAPQDRCSRDKHIQLVNIVDNPGAGTLRRAIAKELSATSTHECLFVDFLFEEEPKKVSDALKHPGWVNAMQEELN